MQGRFFCVALALALAACQGERDSPSPAPTPTPPDPPAVPSATGLPANATGGARQVTEETDTFVFEYSYPQAAGEIPELAALLDRNLERERERLAQEATQGRDEARDNGFPFNKYASGTHWKVVTDLPGWLSMSANLSIYLGGAHPNYAFDTMVWDKNRQIALEPIAFFTSPQDLNEALGEQLCEKLNAERAARRGNPVPQDSGETYDQCIEVNEANLLLGSGDDDTFDRIGIQIAPYLAGPYAEGAYEFTFPVTAELLETVRPEYREAFAARN